MVGEFDTGDVVTTSEECPSSVSSFSGEKIQAPDKVAREVDSNPLKKGAGCLDGVGAKRSGKGSAVGYI